MPFYVADIYPEGVEKAVSEFGATAVAPEVLSLDVDVLAPCAQPLTICHCLKSKPKQLQALQITSLHEDFGELLQQRHFMRQTM